MPEATVIVPTKNRPGYLRTALESLANQDVSHGAYELLVVDDAPSTVSRDVTADVARRVATRIGYVERDGMPGLNSARNTGIAASESSFLVLVDDDVEAPKAWLRELLDGRRRHAGYQVFGGPIRLRLEGSRLRMCGREAPPITTLDHGFHDQEVELVWGANMALERDALELAGPFDPGVPLWGDENMWERRVRAAGGHIMYLARAGLIHRRDPRDARLRSLVAEAYRRGRNLRAYSEHAGHAPSATGELRVLGGCVFHTFRYRCGNGILLTAHSAGRVHECLRTG